MKKTGFCFSSSVQTTVAAKYFIDLLDTWFQRSVTLIETVGQIPESGTHEETLHLFHVTGHHMK